MIHLGGVAAGDHRRDSRAPHVGEHAIDAIEAGVDRAEEVFFLLFDDAADALHRFLQLGIGPLHHLGHDRHELETGTARGGPSGGRRARPAAAAA